MHSETFYHRIRICGTLTTLSTLHVGSGDVAERTCGETTITYNTCCAAEGRPYLPATTLRGFLAKVGQGEETFFHRVFGTTEGERGRAGALRVYDAYLASVGSLPPQALQRTALRSYVALNPITGVAKAHQLFSLEYVPIGSVFTCQLELDEMEESGLAYVLHLLAYWDGTARSALGSGASKGRGRVQWTLNKVEGLDASGLQQWLAQEQPLANFYRVLHPIPEYSPPSPMGTRIVFRLYPQGPFLLHDPAYVQAGENVPRLEYSRTPDNRALIPATALRGWIRSRARRILLTLGVEKGQTWEKASTQAEALLGPLFGSTQQQSLLWFDDALSPQMAQSHLQIFNAIDRFTGGVAKGKLYQVCAAECKYLEGAVYWPKASLDSIYQGLLLFLIRDALEGDLVLGWGKGRGYGCFQVGIQVEEEREIRSWSELKAFLQGRDPLLFQESLKALHNVI